MKRIAVPYDRTSCPYERIIAQKLPAPDNRIWTGMLPNNRYVASHTPRSETLLRLALLFALAAQSGQFAKLGHTIEEIPMKASLIVVAIMLFFLIGDARAQNVNDAQIASIVVTANQVDIDAGRLAHATSRSADVKKFAQLMIDDHTGVNKSATELVTKLHVTPEDNPTSQSLKSDGEKNVAHLKSLKGTAFDKAYIDHEVAYHQQVIDAIDKTLIPDAKNADLKALLVKVRPAFVAHLEHAKQLQSTVGTATEHAR